MKIREVFNSRLPRLLGVDAITIYPFIFYAGTPTVIFCAGTHTGICYSGPPTDIVRRHEWEHVAQVRRVGWFKFYASYLYEYLCHRIISRWSHFDSYANISFELEAYAVQNDGRRPWE